MSVLRSKRPSPHALLSLSTSPVRVLRLLFSSRVRSSLPAVKTFFLHRKDRQRLSFRSSTDLRSPQSDFRVSLRPLRCLARRANRFPSPTRASGALAAEVRATRDQLLGRYPRLTDQRLRVSTSTL